MAGNVPFIYTTWHVDFCLITSIIILSYQIKYRVFNLGCSISIQGHFQQELITTQYRAWCIGFMNYIKHHRIIHVYCVMFNTICELNVFLSKIRYFFPKKNELNRNHSLLGPRWVFMKANIWETERWWYKESSALFNSYETFLWTYPRLSKEEKQKKCEKLPYYKLTRITQRVVDRSPSSSVHDIGQKP